MMDRETLQKRIDECTKLGWWYQEIYYPYKEDGYTRLLKSPVKDDMHPESFGEGKWDNYIAPFLRDLDYGNEIFCDVGCNAGKHLHCAHYWGFKRLWGIEGAEAGFAQLELTKDCYGHLDIRPVFARIGTLEKNIAHSKAPIFKISKFPIVDVTLMANVNYWINKTALLDYCKKLAYKARYLIVIGDNNANGLHNYIGPNIKDWEHLNIIETPHETLKSGGRNLFADLYKSRHLELVDVEEMYPKQMMTRPDNVNFYGRVWPEFVRKVLSESPFKADKCAVFDWLVKGEYGSAKFLPIPAKRRVIRWRRMIKDFAERGQYRPIRILKPGRTDLIDGCHRLGLAHILKIPYLYAVREK